MCDCAETVARLERRIGELELQMAGIPAFTPATASVHEIVLMAARSWQVSAADIYADRRAAAITEPRFAAVWVARTALPISLPRIGQAIGKRDHTTILHALRRAERLRHRNPDFRRITDAMVEAVSRSRVEAAARWDAELAGVQGTPELSLVGEAA